MDDLSKRILTRLAVLGSILWPVAMLSILFAGYRGTPWSFAISFQIDDGWCDWSAGQGVGTHCFGDFGYPYKLGGSVSPYSPGNGLANATPLMLHIFNLLRLFEYNSALLVYLALLLAPTVVLAFWVCRPHASPALLFAQLFGGVATIGFLIGFDRGNHVVWVLPLLVLLIVSAEEGNFMQSVVWVVLISLLKWWGPVFVVVLLAKRRMREAFLSIALTAFGHGALLLAYPSLSFRERISSTFSEIFNEDYALHVSRYAVSAKAWFGRMICTFGEADCSAVTPGQMLSNSVVTVGISLTIVAAVTVIASKLGLKHPYSVMAVCSLTFLPIPEAAAYNLVGASAAVLTLVYFSGKTAATPTEGGTLGVSVKETLSQWWAAGSLALGVIPIGWYSFKSGGVALPIPVDQLGDVRFAQVVVPPLWLGVLVLGLMEVARNRSKGETEV